MNEGHPKYNGLLSLIRLSFGYFRVPFYYNIKTHQYMKLAKQYSAVGALIVAALLSLLSFNATLDVTANMLILIAQFLVYSLTLFGFGEIANMLINRFKK